MEEESLTGAAKDGEAAPTSNAALRPKGKRPKVNFPRELPNGWVPPPFLWVPLTPAMSRACVYVYVAIRGRPQPQGAPT